MLTKNSVSDCRMNPRMLLILAMMCLATTTGFSANNIEDEIDEEYEDDEDYEDYEEDEDDDGYMGEVGTREEISIYTKLVANKNETAPVVTGSSSGSTRARCSLKCHIVVIIIIIVIK